MVVESITILAVCAVLLASLLRSKTPRTAIMIVPVAIIPSMYLLMYAVSRWLISASFSINYAKGIVLGQLLALALACVVIAVQSIHIKNSIGRWVYLVSMVGLSSVLTWIYVFESVGTLLEQFI